jgi:hypothetical protein
MWTKRGPETKQAPEHSTTTEKSNPGLQTKPIPYYTPSLLEPLAPDNKIIKRTVIPPLTEEWKAGRQEYLIILCLANVCVMASLDSSIFLPVLPVSA